MASHPRLQLLVAVVDGIRPIKDYLLEQRTKGLCANWERKPKETLHCRRENRERVEVKKDHCLVVVSNLCKDSVAHVYQFG